jgi:O-antigen/teichoic acid export membrane protein
MLRFSVPMIAFSVSQYVIQAIDIIILGIYRPAREVGVYAFAYQGYGVLQQVSSTATVVLSPLFVSLAVATREGVIHRFYKRMAPQALLLTSIATGIGASFVPLVVLVAAGHAYVAAAAPLALLLFAWILFSAASFVAPIMVLHERSRALGLISVVAALLNVVGDFVLVGIAGVGIVGPAIATAASLVVIAGGYFYVAADCLQLRPSFPLAMLLPGAAGVAAALAFHGILVPAVGVLAVIVSSIVVFRLAKPFSAQDVDMIDKLDIPEPLKKRVVGVLLRVA